MSIIQLECGCNNYPWGKTRNNSLVAQYAASTPSRKFKLDDKPWAEMWCGTYPTKPSSILSSGEDLQKHLNANQEILIGQPILGNFGADLPYLPKILSIAKALPLQIHPDKDLAAKLHKQDPGKYVALSKFEVFVGFKPLPEIEKLFTSIPILKSKFPPGIHQSFNDDLLKRIVGQILSASDEDIAEVYETLKKTPKEDFSEHFYIPELLSRLAEQYDKSDPGSLVALLTMNFLVLQKGDAIYVPAGGIHAYLSGDIVECMARSDNVINTGFCPQADRDSVALFTSALTFSPKSGKDAILKPEKSNKGAKDRTKVFAPPMSEFNVLLTELKWKDAETIQAIQGPSIMIVTGGKGRLKADNQAFEVKEGYVFFIGYNTEFTLEAAGGLETYVAYAEA